VWYVAADHSNPKEPMTPERWQQITKLFEASARVALRWSRDGHEIFYLDAQGQIVAATVKTGRTFEVENATALFKTRIGFPSVSVYPPANAFFFPSLSERQARSPWC
jgi:hypothetical protein